MVSSPVAAARRRWKEARAETPGRELYDSAQTTPWATQCSGRARPNAGQGYVLEKWTTVGKSIQRLQRNAEWFAADDPLRKFGRGVENGERRPGERPSPPTAMPVHVDPDGLVITYVWVPNAR